MAKVKFQIEQMLTSTSETVIWNAVATPIGMESWFADRVEVNGRIYTFHWGKEETRSARLSSSLTGSFIRFKWCDEEEPACYFEFRITRDELTDDYTLIITDFAEPDEIADAKGLWETEIAALLRNDRL